MNPIRINQAGADWLREGQIVDAGTDGICEVELVNDCRARLRPVGRQKVVIKPAFGDAAEFSVPMKGLNVSPRSGIPILADSFAEYRRRQEQNA